MSTIKEFFKKEGVELAQGQLTNIGLTIILPPLVSVVTFAWGFFQNLPMPYLFAATALTFGGVAAGMHHFSQLFYQRTPEGKLRFGAAGLAKRLDHKKLVAIKYGVAIQSLAIFPIEYEVRPIHVSLGASINPKPSRDLVGGVVPVGGTMMWWEAEVPVTKEMKGELLEGHFDLEILYGRIGKKRFSAKKKWKPIIKFNNAGDVETVEFTELE